MPRGSRKRKQTSTSSTSASSSKKKKSNSASSGNNNNNSNSNMWSSGSSRKKTSRSSKSSSSTSTESGGAESLFQSIADPDDPSVATMEGLSVLCDQLGLDALEDVRILVLMWKMNAVDKPAQISKTEWMTACSKLHIDSLTKLQSLLPSLDVGFMDEREYKDFYKFCFQFNRQGTHRTLDKDLVVALLPLVAPSERIPTDRVQSFCSFLQQSSSDYGRITLDQWTSFLDFCHDVEDLTAYDLDNSAWPVLIDEYVEYMLQLQADQDKMVN